MSTLRPRVVIVTRPTDLDALLARHGGTEDVQSSSGIIVSSGTELTGWAA
ncbi:MAG: hypothetical protein AAFY65_05070 [Pseudomonadota bacterium]